ncbi:MAG: 8-amino-7-oxononanoate synthase [Cellvibrionales bacterium]|nr:8-amino-7-oxononanoate synthase [Cellvibrionales bacterium]
MKDLHARLRERLDKRHQAQQMRKVRKVASPMGRKIHMGDRSLLNFSSNDYLGFANHPEIRQATIEAIEQYGVGGGASHSICGHSEAHDRLEQKIATLLNRDDALLFSTGFMANLAVMTSLLERKDAVFQDRWNHASLIDGGLAQPGSFVRYKHNDMGDLKAKLESTPARHRMICADSVFSMDGDICDIQGLISLANAHDALLYLDDAHGFGVLGDNGLGVIDYAKLSQDDLPLVVLTLGKAIGCAGALVVGEKTLIEAIRQYGRSYVYTTASPPAIAAGVSCALDLLLTSPHTRQHLQSLIDAFISGAKAIDLPLMPSSTPIQPLMLMSEDAALSCQAFLEQKGILAMAIRPPTVPVGSCRLRITLTASHSLKDVDYLLACLGQWFEENR